MLALIGLIFLSSNSLSVYLTFDKRTKQLEKRVANLHLLLDVMRDKIEKKFDFDIDMSNFDFDPDISKWQKGESVQKLPNNQKQSLPEA
jgi:hypothetical protein